MIITNAFKSKQLIIAIAIATEIIAGQVAIILFQYRNLVVQRLYRIILGIRYQTCILKVTITCGVLHGGRPDAIAT